MWPAVSSCIWMHNEVTFKMLCSTWLSRISGRFRVPHLCSSLRTSPLCPVGTAVSSSEQGHTHSLESYQFIKNSFHFLSLVRRYLVTVTRYRNLALGHSEEGSGLSKKPLGPFGVLGAYIPEFDFCSLWRQKTLWSTVPHNWSFF